MAYGTQQSSADSLLKLHRSIEAGDIDPVYMFHLKPAERDKDNVEFLISKLTGAIHSQFRHDPGAKYNTDVFEGNEADLQHVLTVAKTMPMFGNRRLTVWRGPSPVKEDDSEKIIDYIKNPSPTTILVLAMLTSKIPDRLLKTAGGLGCAHRIERIAERSLTKWVSGIFRQEGVNISGEAVGTIADFAGCNLQMIEDAKEKLILYTMGKDSIEASDVEELLLASRSADIYELADALWEKNAAMAMKVLSQLEGQKTDALFINTVLAQQVRSLIKIKSITAGKRMRSSEVAALLGMREFIARKQMARVRKFSLREFENALAVCVEMNARLKSSRMSAYRVIEHGAMKILSLHI